VFPEPPEAGDDEGGTPEAAEKKPSLTAVPKTKPKSSPGFGGGSGPEPEPSA